MDLRVVGIACVALAGGVAIHGGVAVSQDPENVVASRLEGEWQLDAGTTQRLRGNASGPGKLSFRSDPSVAERITGEMASFLADNPSYMAGYVERGGTEHPFVLIATHGNPMLLWFRERGGDPMGDAEAALVALAPARERRNDMLFMGGDFNNEPFRAYRRPEHEDAVALRPEVSSGLEAAVDATGNVMGEYQLESDAGSSTIYVFVTPAVLRADGQVFRYVSYLIDAPGLNNDRASGLSSVDALKSWRVGGGTGKEDGGMPRSWQYVAPRDDLRWIDVMEDEDIEVDVSIVKGHL